MSVNNQAGPLKNQIRRLRFEHGEMTQLALAERAGVTRQTIIALEAGKYIPSLLLAFRLARAFGVEVERVFQYEAEDRPPDGLASASD
jgi:putative transcriptional regulator